MPPPEKRSPWLLIVAIVSFALFLGTAGLTVWLWRDRMANAANPADPEEVPAPAPLLVEPAPSAADPLAPSPSPSSTAVSLAPKQSRTWNVGAVTLVDLGIDEGKSLRELLTAERAAARKEGQTLIVMATRHGSSLLRDFDAAIPDPLMQEALAKVRLVRIDSAYFEVELAEVGIPTESYPWFLVMGADLVPRDGINGGEWGDDVARNIAPVLGPFVRGTYKKRREMWKPPPGKGVQL